MSARKDEEQNLFEVEDATGEKWKGKKVVLAMGVKDRLPKDIEGYEENWGYNIHQCLFCDGIERSDRPAGTLGFASPMMLHNVNMMVQMGCPSVTIFGNERLKPESEVTAKALQLAKLRGVDVDERRIRKLVNLGGEEGVEILFEDGTSAQVGFLAHRPDVEVMAPHLARGLGVEIVPDGAGGQMLKRNEPFGETIKGVLAAGDIGAIPKARSHLPCLRHLLTFCPPLCRHLDATSHFGDAAGKCGWGWCTVLDQSGRGAGAGKEFGSLKGIECG